MGIKRAKKQENLSEQPNKNQDPSVKKVQPVNGPEGPEQAESMTSQSESSSMMQDMASTVHKKITTSTTTVTSNWFGIKPVAAKISAGISGISSYLHVPKALVSIVLSVVLAGSGGTAIMMNASSQHDNLVVRQEDEDDDCVEEIEDMKDGTITETGTMEEYAAKIYSVGKALGMTDEQCAGMMGNVHQECHFDPTCIEGIYDEPFTIGPKKTAAFADLNSYTIGPLKAKYDNCGKTMNLKWYVGLEGKYICGLGLFQFTGPEGSNLLNYAKSGNMDWFNIDLQLAFSFDDVDGYKERASWVKQWIANKTSANDVSQAAKDWNAYFEGNGYGKTQESERVVYAQQWYAKIKSGQVVYDASYAQSIIALANRIGTGSLSAAVSEAEDECAEAVLNVDNSDLARAAVAYAYSTKEEGIGNDGTELYRYVHEQVFPGDPWFQSCDRSVATAVRWSDADDEFPAGGTDVIWEYLAMATDKWEFVGMGADIQANRQFQPGDVCISQGHIVIYVGNEIIREKYPNAPEEFEFVSGSISGHYTGRDFPGRSPGCGTDNCSVNSQGEPYKIYRLKHYEANGKYKDVAKGKNLADGR